MACTFSLTDKEYNLNNPSNTTAYIDHNDAQPGVQETITFNATTSGGRDSFVTELTEIIESKGGTVDSLTLSYDAPTTTLTVNLEATYEELDAVLSLITMDADGYYPSIECEESAEPTASACDACQELSLKACQSTYTITAGLTADTEYVVILTDRWNNEYFQTVTSDAGGDLVIDMTEFPSGFTTPENSPVKLSVREEEDSTTDETLTIGATTFPCINIHYVYREDVGPVVLFTLLIDDIGEAFSDDTQDEIAYD